MKSIPSPTVGDDDILRSIANDSRLGSYPLLKPQVNLILGQYAAYVSAKGNPLAANAPQPARFPNSVKEALRKHYASPPNALAYLAEIRDHGSPDVCPMCGSLKSGTLDHVFPKNAFAEFSVFSKNLVPACDCNSKRKDSYKGKRPGERVLHPYFDGGMNRRLLRAQLAPSSGSFRRPVIGLKICIPTRDPLFPAVAYHFENVVMRTQVIEYLECFWPKILRFYDDYFRLPGGKFSAAELDKAVGRAVKVHDRRRSTPNNWDSMLLAGLSSNASAKAFVRQTILDLRADKLNVDEI